MRVVRGSMGDLIPRLLLPSVKRLMVCFDFLDRWVWLRPGEAGGLSVDAWMRRARVTCAGNALHGNPISREVMEDAVGQEVETLT